MSEIKINESTGERKIKFPTREIEDDFLNDSTNSFQRTFHERKPGYVNLKIEGWFTRKQIINNYEMLIKELDDWKINKDGIRWKYK